MKQIKYNNFTTINSDEVALDDFYFFQGALSDEVIARVLEVAVTLPRKTGVIGGTQLHEDTSYRASFVSWIPVATENHWIYDLLGKYATTANERMWHFGISGCAEEVQYGEYHASNHGHYDWHMDLGKSSPHRKISMSVQLSDTDDYEGGELHFMSGRTTKTASRKKGTVIVFPSYLLHRVTPVTRGVRKSLVLWLSGDPFR